LKKKKKKKTVNEKKIFKTILTPTLREIERSITVEREMNMFQFAQILLELSSDIDVPRLHHVTELDICQFLNVNYHYYYRLIVEISHRIGRNRCANLTSTIAVFSLICDQIAKFLKQKKIKEKNKEINYITIFLQVFFFTNRTQV
jgi:hypothetical protein